MIKTVQIATEFVEGIAVAGALLTDVEAGKGEAEDVHLRQQGVEGFTGELSADQAVADQLQVAAEFSDRSVVQGFAGLCIWRAGRPGPSAGRLPAGIRQLIVAQLGELAAVPACS